MGVIKMLDTRVSSEHCTCYMTSSGGLEWPHRCRMQSATVSIASSMKAPLELLHVDFTSIETTMELYQPPNMLNLLVFCDHFTKHVMAYMTPNQTVKTVAKFLWQGFILIFRAPAKLLSD